MEEQQTDNTRLIFGLGPFATMINSLLLLFVSSILNAVYFCANYSSDVMDQTKTSLENPWYISFPFFVLSWLMFTRYLKWRYMFPVKGFSLKEFAYQIFFLVCFTIFESAMKLILINQLITVL